MILSTYMNFDEKLKNHFFTHKSLLNSNGRNSSKINEKYDFPTFHQSPYRYPISSSEVFLVLFGTIKTRFKPYIMWNTQSEPTNSASTKLQMGITFDLIKIWTWFLVQKKALISYFLISNISATKNQEWHGKPRMTWKLPFFDFFAKSQNMGYRRNRGT